MARRTQTFKLMPWVGGINTSVDPGVLNPQELVQADNVVFSSTGARIKREALQYLDSDLPTPDLRSSSGTTRTLKWTTNALVNIASPNERLVVGEKINVAGVANYSATNTSILTRTEVKQVIDVTCVADVAGSLTGKYFTFSAGDSGSDYYVWFKVDSVGTDPEINNHTGIEVALSAGSSAATIASAIETAVDALADFTALAASDSVSIRCVIGGLTQDPDEGDSGFTIDITTKGGHEITYTAQSSLAEAETSAGALTIERASKVISITDYWRFATDATNQQILVYATNNFQLFTLDDSGRRVQIHGQEQVSTILCQAASTLTSGDYFLLNSPASGTQYAVWYNKDSGGGTPAISGRTLVEVAVSSADTAEQVAIATQLAIENLSDFTATVNTATVTTTTSAAGICDANTDVNTGFTFNVLKYGATAPVNEVSRICAKVVDEDLVIAFTGLGNYMIQYNPDDDSKYQLLVDNISGAEIVPDASFFFTHQGRMWCNDKNNQSRLHFCETFDKTKWMGFGDSGALDIDPGDGDPEGITNAYVYKGFIVVGKKASRHRIMGDSPENYFRETISSGLGNEGPLAIPVDESDVVFVSRRGIHSQQVTDSYGDTDAAYLSSDIKPTFNNWEAESLKNMQGTYIPELNSIALAVTENGQNSNNAIWLYNVEARVPGKETPGAWYRWPDISCTALSRKYINGKYKIICGTSNGRILQAQKERDYSDFGTEGIPFRIKTGTIYPNNDPHSVKAFKKLTMIYRPKGNFAFTVTTKIDNARTQAFSFNQISGLDLLGQTFVLGNSLLGSSNTLAPFTFTMDGYGRGISLDITQPTANEQVEIWGFIIEYESADLRQSADEESASSES